MQQPPCQPARGRLGYWTLSSPGYLNASTCPAFSPYMRASSEERCWNMACAHAWTLACAHARMRARREDRATFRLPSPPRRPPPSHKAPRTRTGGPELLHTLPTPCPCSPTAASPICPRSAHLISGWGVGWGGWGGGGVRRGEGGSPARADPFTTHPPWNSGSLPPIPRPPPSFWRYFHGSGKLQ